MTLTEKTGEGGLSLYPPAECTSSLQSLSIPRPSTSVLSSVHSILYPQSYCSLHRSRIHCLCNQEIALDRFNLAYNVSLPIAAAVHRPVDNGRFGWRDQHRNPR